MSKCTIWIIRYSNGAIECHYGIYEGAVKKAEQYIEQKDITYVVI